MATVGERLKLMRESRNTSIEEMVVATGIGQSYLEAVEKDEIQALHAGLKEALNAIASAPR